MVVVVVDSDAQSFSGTRTSSVRTVVVGGGGVGGGAPNEASDDADDDDESVVVVAVAAFVGRGPSSSAMLLELQCVVV